MNPELRNVNNTYAHVRALKAGQKGAREKIVSTFRIPLPQFRLVQGFIRHYCTVSPSPPPVKEEP